jgi:hypothetical protein
LATNPAAAVKKTIIKELAAIIKKLMLLKFLFSFTKIFKPQENKH